MQLGERYGVRQKSWVRQRGEEASVSIQYKGKREGMEQCLEKSSEIFKGPGRETDALSITCGEWRKEKVLHIAIRWGFSNMKTRCLP